MWELMELNSFIWTCPVFRFLRGSKPSKTLCAGDVKCFICVCRAIDSHTRPEDGPRVTDRTCKVRLG